MIKRIHGDLPSSRSIKKINKKIYIENLGCAKNQVDAEIYGEILSRKGWTWCDNPESADCILINSCGFIQSAKEESIEETLAFKTRFPAKKIVLTGCFAQRYGTSAGKRLKDIDGIIGNQSPERLSELLEEINSGRRIVEVPEQNRTYPYRSRLLSYPGSVYVKISEGCNNRCSYCAIPLIRGPLVSRDKSEIVDEIGQYIDNGAKEIILLAQDIASYGTEGGGVSELPSLLSAVGELSGDFWLRLLYIHPDHFTEELIPVINKDNRILPYFDLPFQHASERILRKMGRTGNAERYLRLIENIRSNLPGAVIRSTFLVGFPGEKNKDFEELVRFQDMARIDWLGVFSYSREEETAAYSMQSGFGHYFTKRKGQKRKEIIEERQQDITAARLRRHTGSKLRVLIEEPVIGEHLYIGRTAFQAPEVDGLTVIAGEGLVPGTFVEGIITKVTAPDLEAALAAENGA